VLIIASLRSGFARLLSTAPRFGGWLVQFAQPIAVPPGRFLGLAAKRLLTQLPILGLQMLNPLFQLLDPLGSTGMHLLPIACLLAQLQVLTPEPGNLLTQLRDFPSQFADQADQVRRKLQESGSTVFHDGSGLPKTPVSS